MSRPIEFRAWNTVTKKMQYPVSLEDIRDDGGEAEHSRETYTWSLGKYDIEDLVWLQYTGLRDKNGTKIFEGDILKTDYGNYFLREALPFIVLVDCNDYGKPDEEQDEYSNGDFYQGLDIRHHSWKEFEVIGSIYENPDLLKDA